MSDISLYDVALLIPEFIVAGTILLLVGADLFMEDAKAKRKQLAYVALAGLLISGGFIIGGGDAIATAFYGQVAVDPFGRLFKLIFIAVSGFAIFTGMLSKELQDRHMAEYYALLMSITFGMFLMVGANDLLTVYLGTEMVSIVSFAMAGYRLHDRKSSEAALKYVIYGGAASGLMLFGISLFYGMLGTTELTALYHAMAEWNANEFNQNAMSGGAPYPLAMLVAIVFLFAGVGYKVAVVPFHMWSPDVYQGAPTPFAGFLSVGPKAAGFAMFMRLFVGIFIAPDAGGGQGFASDSDGFMELTAALPLPAMLGIVAAFTMTFGNLAAINQDNVKRLLAYSSIAHAGYLLTGMVVLSESALHAVSFYLVIYYLMNIGAFAIVQVVRDRTGGELLSNFRGLGERSPMLAIYMTIFLLSLTGLPPLAGFIGKFYIFAAVMAKGGTWFYVLAIIGMINSAISLFYYAKVIKVMWLAKPLDATPLPQTRAFAWLTGALAVPTLILGVYWQGLSVEVRDAMAMYRSAPQAAHAQLLPDGE